MGDDKATKSSSAAWIALAVLASGYAVCSNGPRERTQTNAGAAPVAQATPPPVPPDMSVDPEEARLPVLQDRFRGQGRKALVAAANEALAIAPPTRESIQTASVALAFIDDEDHSDVRRTKALLEKRSKEQLAADPEQQAQLDAIAGHVQRGIVATQIKRILVGSARAEKVWYTEDGKGGPELWIEGPICTQAFANSLAINPAIGGALREAKFRSVRCKGDGFLSYYHADL